MSRISTPAEYLREIGAKGGKARAENQTGKERSALARHAALTRWSRVREPKAKKS